MSKDGTGIKGALNIKLTGPNGEVKVDKTIKNLITTNGDKYYAQMGCAGVGGNSAPTLADGMKLGGSSAAVTKASTGAAINDYISGSNNTFDSVTAAVVSGDTGWKITYVASWAAGDATDTIEEAVICTDAETDDAGAASDVISRVLTGTIVKGEADTLTLTWVHTFFDNPA